MSKKEQQTFILELKILSKILRSSWTMDRSTLALLGERHLMLEKTIIPLIPDSTFITPEVAQKLKQAESTRNDFIIDVQEAFLTNNTKFVDYLKSFGLTRSELNYCCLLTLGLRGNEIGIITNNRNHYNHSSMIRQKLKLAPNDTNLGNYLRYQYETIQSETTESIVPK